MSKRFEVLREIAGHVDGLTVRALIGKLPAGWFTSADPAKEVRNNVDWLKREGHIEPFDPLTNGVIHWQATPGGLALLKEQAAAAAGEPPAADPAPLAGPVATIPALPDGVTRILVEHYRTPHGTRHETVEEALAEMAAHARRARIESFSVAHGETLARYGLSTTQVAAVIAAWERYNAEGPAHEI